MIQGHRLREAREQRALSQGALGKLVAKDGAYISKIERGVLVSVSTTTLERLVTALELSADYLLGLHEPPTQTTRQRRKPSSRGQKAVHQDTPAPAPAARRRGSATNGTQPAPATSPEPEASPRLCLHCFLTLQVLPDAQGLFCPACRYSITEATWLTQVIAQLQAAGLQSMDLLHPDYRDSDRSEFPLDGLCHPLSQALFCLRPGKFTAWFIAWEDGDGHVFLRDAEGVVVDLVSFPDLLLCDEDYNAAVPVRWRPRIPAQRTRTLVARAELAFPTPAPAQKGA